MKIYLNNQHSQHVGRFEMHRGRLVPYHETAERVTSVLREIERRDLGELRLATELDPYLVERVHDADYLMFLMHAWRDWVALDAANAEMDILPSVWPNHGLRRDISPTNFSARVGQYAFDAGTPIAEGTWRAALGGAASAEHAAKAVLGGARVSMALTRPPGHHAGRNFCGGYCYLNNSAIAAQSLRDGGAARVAIVDVDYHHGNGTQEIFYERNDVFTASLHGDPTTEYPFYLGYADERGTGRGEGFNRNVPLPVGTDFATWSAALHDVLRDVRAFNADALVVPLGVDTFVGDPISRFTFTSDDFTRMGAQLASAGLPTVFVMEGGYAVSAIGVNVCNVLQGFGEGRDAGV